MGKYDKYICTTLEKRHLLPGPTPEQRDKLTAEGRRIPMEHVHWMDAEVIPGAYYGETVWMWPADFPGQTSWQELCADGCSIPVMFPHAHSFPELLSWWGVNSDDPADVDPMAMQIGDEIIPLKGSWVAYAPADIPHMPVFEDGTGSNIFKKPSVHWTFGPGGVYVMETDDEEEAQVGHHKEVKDPEPDVVTAQVITDEATSKYARYIVYDTPADIERPDFMRPVDREYQREMAYIDKTVIPDAELGCDTRWLLPGSAEDQVIFDEHTLPYATTVACVAYNYENLTDLCGEAELWIGGEKHVLDKGFWVYIPANVPVGPLVVRNIDKQIFFLRAWPMGEGITKYPGGQ